MTDGLALLAAWAEFAVLLTLLGFLPAAGRAPMTRSALLGIAVCTLALSGCVAPAPDDAAYESKVS